MLREKREREREREQVNGIKNQGSLQFEKQCFAAFTRDDLYQRRTSDSEDNSDTKNNKRIIFLGSKM